MSEVGTTSVSDGPGAAGVVPSDCSTTMAATPGMVSTRTSRGPSALGATKSAALAALVSMRSFGRSVTRPAHATGPPSASYTVMPGLAPPSGGSAPATTSKRIRCALVTAANWPVVVVQFIAETTFQVLLAVPLIGAAILVTVLLGADLAEILQGSLREIFTTVASTLLSEPLALVAFITAFSLVLLGGSVMMFVVKGGTVEVMLAAEAAAGSI